MCVRKSRKGQSWYFKTNLCAFSEILNVRFLYLTLWLLWVGAWCGHKWCHSLSLVNHSHKASIQPIINRPSFCRSGQGIQELDPADLALRKLKLQISKFILPRLVILAQQRARLYIMYKLCPLRIYIKNFLISIFQHPTCIFFSNLYYIGDNWYFRC